MKNVYFNDINYTIDSVALESASTALKSHFETVMNGSGAVINFDGVAYNIDSNKLATVTNNFVTHLGTINGDGKKVVVNSIEYSVDSTKIQNAMSELHTVLDGLQSDNEDNRPIPAGAYYLNFATQQFYTEMPETVSEMDAYLYGDYVYYYMPNNKTDGWGVTLALEEKGILNYIPNYPVTNLNKKSYDEILTNINGVPVTSLGHFTDSDGLDAMPCFANCTEISTAGPEEGQDITIPNTITSMVGTFEGCTSLGIVIIPEGVTDITSICNGCEKLSWVLIPSTVTSIGEYAFNGCADLYHMQFSGTVEQWNALPKGEGWNAGAVSLTQVVCSDGTVNLI